MKKFFAILTAVISFWFTALPAQQNQLGRAEVVVLSGKILAPFVGTQDEKLALFAQTSNGVEVIPFQIDHRIKDGGKIRYLYPAGPLKDKFEPILAEMDELVFWSADAGERVNESALPEAVKKSEIEIKDPISGKSAYVYLLAFSDKAPRSNKYYVKYQPEEDRIEALYYNLDYPEDSKLSFTDLTITQQAGGSGEDFVVEAKYRVSVFITGTIIPYELDKKQLHSKVLAYSAGPIRARRKLVNYLELWMWLGSTSFAENVYTPSGFYVEVPVVGFSPVKFLTNLNTRWALELNSNALGMTFKSDKNIRGVKIDGSMSEDERNMNYSPPEWLLVEGKPGAVIRRPAKLSDRTLFLDLYYMDNAELNEENETEKGQIGSAGYYIPFAGRRGLKMRENIGDFFDVLPFYQTGDEQKFLERIANPLQIKTIETETANQLPAPKQYPKREEARKDVPAPSITYVGAEAPEIESQILPVIVMSSDNGFGGGLMYVHANPFNTGIRFMAQSWYTIKSYSLTEIKLGEERPQDGDFGWVLYGKYHLRPGRDFYGLGNDSERDDQTNFYDEIIMAEFRFNKRLFGPLWAGAFAEIHHEFTTHGEGDWAPDTFEAQWFPDLLGKGAFWTNRIGAFVMIDTRDSIYIPTKGGYYKLEYYSVPEWMGSDFNFEYWYLDLRQFITLRAPRKDILALRFQAKRGVAGPIPFYELAVAGSEYTLRGYYDGRFRDRDMLSINTELRHNLWKIFDIHLFYDIGRVYNDMFDEWRYIANDTHYAWGIGFRTTIPPNVVMRGDVGWSDTDQVFYFNWGQTF